MIDAIEQSATDRMGKSIESLRNALTHIRTGRAHPGLLDNLKVKCYGAEMLLKQLAGVNVADACTLAVDVWDQSQVAAVEKAIRESDLGLNPVVNGKLLHVPLPLLTEERRHEMVRLVRTEAEHARVAVRNIRRDAVRDIRELADEKEISEDEQHKAEHLVQQLTDRSTSEINALLQAKEKDLIEH